MKKQIDLRKRCAESDKICAYMKIGYRAIDDWNELMPVVQKVADDILGLHDGSYCDADTLYEHNFVNLLYKDVTYVRNIVCNTIDWLLKQSITEVHGCLYRLTVENLYNHKELRDALANEQIHHVVDGAYVWIVDGGEGQVFSFVDDTWTEGGSVVNGYSADSWSYFTFCNEFIKARTKIEMITKLYDCAGDNVEPKIVFES
jgi:hypothetical protein